MLKGIINGRINRKPLFITFSTSMLKSVINVLVIVSEFVMLASIT